MYEESAGSVSVSIVGTGIPTEDGTQKTLSKQVLKEKSFTQNFMYTNCNVHYILMIKKSCLKVI